MEERALKPIDLSYLARMPLPRVCDILSGKTQNSKIDTVAKLARALDMPVDDLINKDYVKSAA